MAAPSSRSPGLHPRNRHQGRYDFAALVKACPALKRCVVQNPAGQPTVDFADPVAVRLLNRALLASQYGVQAFDVPEGYLVPPVPGRADYVHHVADLLAGGGAPPRGAGVRLLDLGTGASAVYALLGHLEYGWTCVGCDIDRGALASARRILAANPGLEAGVDLRFQGDAESLLDGVVLPGECFDVLVCNPPFHASRTEAQAGTQRKWRNLGRGGRREDLNFGGQAAELWCPGGEVGFISRLIAESRSHAGAFRWFTCLVAKSEHLPALRQALREAGAEHLTIDMGQGAKRSRFLAWRFR